MIEPEGLAYFRLLQYLGRSTLEQQGPIMDEHHPVGNGGRGTQVMGNHQDGEVHDLAQARDDFIELRGPRMVQPRQRLVEQEQPRHRLQRQRQQHTLELTAGEIPETPFNELLGAYACKGLTRLFAYPSRIPEPQGPTGPGGGEKIQDGKRR